MKINSNSPKKSYLALSIAAAISASGYSHLAFAQQQEGDEVKLEEIVVTGSRIRRGDFVEPNPVVSLNANDLKNLGITNMAEAMTTQISQNISNFQPTMTGDLLSMSSSFFVGATLANLRGLNDVNNFGSRTLTLVNGRRVVSTSNQADVVDMNIIPSNMLQRMDVVTGGASAAYGSGAMAGVVNLVLDTKLEGVNLDLDYGVTAEGDGDNKHIALSGGTSVLDGRGHLLLGGEWQEQDPIRSCADARDWCGEGWGLINNNSASAFIPGTFTPNPTAIAQGYPQYGDQPAYFFTRNLRYNQLNSNGTIPVVGNADATTGYRFTADGTDVEEYSLGIRGGAGGFSGGPGSQVINGDGPVRATNSSLTSGYERTSMLGRFEYEITEKLQFYTEGSYAKTDALNVQWPTQSWSCVRFDQAGEPAQPEQAGASLVAGAVIPFDFFNPANTHPIWSDPAFLAIAFSTGASFNGTTWILNVPWTLPPIAAQDAVLPARGAGENAFLNTLSPEAVAQLQAAAVIDSDGNMGTSGNTAQSMFGCDGHPGVYKLWAPQLVQSTETETETSRVVFGLKGDIGDTWNWDLYYQYGLTESRSLQRNAQTTWRYYFATDSIIDPRASSSTFGEPVCRVTVDGVPTATPGGDTLSFDLSPLAEGCAPLNPFGINTASQESLNYAFRPLVSEGDTRLDVLSLSSSGQLWRGWGAGPLYAAVGAEIRQDEVDNGGSQGATIERIDFPFPWADGFGGKTTVYEEFVELDVPLLKDLPFVNTLSINTGVRHSRYENKGGAGTTGAEGVQTITNWKASLIYEPLDWLRLRATRSRDMRAATYRELYINQRSVDDSTQATNPWRPKGDEDDSEGFQTDRRASNTVGNPDLEPEKSDTFTAGFVLSPGGWAEGMQFSADYYQIDVEDGLALAFENPITACFQESGNVEQEFFEDDPATPFVDESTIVSNTPILDQFDPNNESCQRVHFGDPDPDFVGNPYSNITSTDNTYTNNNPFQIRGVDVAWDYSFPLSKVFEDLPGGIALRLTGTHSLEASSTSFGRYYDLSGQVGNGLQFTFGLPVQPTPEWAGNLSMTYYGESTSVTLSGRYVGEGKLDVIFPGTDNGSGYRNANGEYLAASVNNNTVPSYMNWSLNASYNLQLTGMEQFQIWGQINNLFDEDPRFTGGFIGGTSPQFYDTLGRSFKLGIRTRF